MRRRIAFLPSGSTRKRIVHSEHAEGDFDNIFGTGFIDDGYVEKALRSSRKNGRFEATDAVARLLFLKPEAFVAAALKAGTTYEQVKAQSTPEFVSLLDRSLQTEHLSQWQNSSNPGIIVAKLGLKPGF